MIISFEWFESKINDIEKDFGVVMDFLKDMTTKYKSGKTSIRRSGEDTLKILMSVKNLLAFFEATADTIIMTAIAVKK